jgi:hypothetical protein
MGMFRTEQCWVGFVHGEDHYKVQAPLCVLH